jgi:hypothetical protein
MSKIKRSYVTLIIAFILFFIIGLFGYSPDTPKSFRHLNQFFPGPLEVYGIYPTKCFRLNGFNFPPEARPLSGINLRGCSGQYLSSSILLSALVRIRDIKIEVIPQDDTTAYKNKIRPDINIFIEKIWFQAGIHNKDIRKQADYVLTQELLIKNDSLIKVDIPGRQNFLLVKQSDGRQKYVNISSRTPPLMDSLIIEDSPCLRPFSMDKLTTKPLWLTTHIPSECRPGLYHYDLKISYGNITVFSFPMTVEVLPFELEPSPLIYSIYYHGVLKDFCRPFHYIDKSPRQMERELNDMKEHGILYPTNYQATNYLEKNLSLRKKVGLPDKYAFSIRDFFSDFLITGNFELIEKRIPVYQEIYSRYGYNNIYYYALDESNKDQILKQSEAWRIVKKLGGKIFASTEKKLLPLFNREADILVLFGIPSKSKADLAHIYGNKVFSYASPQAGEENPEIYRRNFGLLLWKAGYDGAMDYAYQKGYGSIWDDFDDPAGKYRDETFTYPVSNGVISTVQWEGFREGVNDVRFIATLVKLVRIKKAQHHCVKKYEKLINRLDPGRDPDSLREEIIDAIVELVRSK